MIDYRLPDDRQFVDEPPSARPWPRTCAYCGGQIAGPSERLHHTSINFAGPPCQRVQPAPQLQHEVKE